MPNVILSYVDPTGRGHHLARDKFVVGQPRRKQWRFIIRMGIVRGTAIGGGDILPKGATEADARARFYDYVGRLA